MSYEMFVSIAKYISHVQQWHMNHVDGKSTFKLLKMCACNIAKKMLKMVQEEEKKMMCRRAKRRRAKIAKSH